MNKCMYIVFSVIELGGVYSAKTELSLSFLSSTCQLQNNSSFQTNCCFPFIPCLFCCQCLSWAAHTKLTLQHIDMALSFFFFLTASVLLTLSLSLSLPPFFSPHFSAGMHSYWLLSTVVPASLQDSWCSQCWASWRQSKAWTSVR